MPNFKKYLYLLGIFLFAIILIQTDVRLIWQNVKEIHLLYLLSAALLSLPILATKSYCWNYIKKKQGINYSFIDSFLMYGVGMYIGCVTPGRIGEVGRIVYLKKDGYSFGKSLVSLILDRLSDFVFLLIFVLLGSLFLFNYQYVFLPLTAVLLFVALVFVFYKLNLIEFFLKKIFHLAIPVKYQKSWKKNSQDFVHDFKIYNLKNYSIIFLITAFSWFFYYVQMYVLARSVNISNIPILYLSVALTVVGFITLIPVSISGIGTRDAALIIFFTPFLISKEQIIAFSSLILLMHLFHVVIGLVCWMIKPIPLSN